MYLVDIPGREIAAGVQEEEALPRSWGQGYKRFIEGGSKQRRCVEGFASKAIAMRKCGGGEDK